MIFETTEVLQERGVGVDEAQNMSVEIIDRLMHKFGGSYLPRGLKISTMRRNTEIRRAFNGKNYRELSVKYKLTENAIRGIVRKSK